MTDINQLLLYGNHLDKELKKNLSNNDWSNWVIELIGVDKDCEAWLNESEDKLALSLLTETNFNTFLDNFDKCFQPFVYSYLAISLKFKILEKDILRIKFSFQLADSMERDSFSCIVMIIEDTESESVLLDKIYHYDHAEEIKPHDHRTTLTPEVVKDLTNLKNVLFFYNSLRDRLGKIDE